MKKNTSCLNKHAAHLKKKEVQSPPSTGTFRAKVCLPLALSQKFEFISLEQRKLAYKACESVIKSVLKWSEEGLCCIDLRFWTSRPLLHWLRTSLLLKIKLLAQIWSIFDQQIPVSAVCSDPLFTVGLCYIKAPHSWQAHFYLMIIVTNQLFAIRNNPSKL